MSSDLIDNSPARGTYLRWKTICSSSSSSFWNRHLFSLSLVVGGGGRCVFN
jgi:hypothetical protein